MRVCLALLSEGKRGRLVIEKQVNRFMKLGIHIFRRDFRLSDNAALYKCSKVVDRILCVFILDVNQPSQVGINSSVVNVHSMKLMLDSLYELNESELNGRLLVLRGKLSSVLEYLIKTYKPYAISFNNDYSEYSKIRDSLMCEIIMKMSKEQVVSLDRREEIKIIREDYEMLLDNPEEYIKSSDGRAYTVYGAYIKNLESKGLLHSTRKPFVTVGISIIYDYKKSGNSCKLEVELEKRDSYYCNREYIINRIREEARIKSDSYAMTRRQIDRDQLRTASVLKFGILSAVELFRLIHLRGEQYVQGLHWRNFYFLIRIYNYTGYRHMDSFFSTRVKWPNLRVNYERMWVTCNTGFPIIDACVRKLKKTGWLNNRANLLVSFFSIKILHLDPFDEKYGGQVEYSKYLEYCCYANNYCNWNFALGVLDQGAQRYTGGRNRAGRYYDVTNIRKWDPDLNTIRCYLPELSGINDERVYNWNHENSYVNNLNVSKEVNGYPVAGIVDPKKAFEKYKKMTSTV